jgi:hypothetical protein
MTKDGKDGDNLETDRSCFCYALRFGRFSFLAGSAISTSQARKAGITKPGDVLATDILGLQLSLFHSPWYRLELAMIVSAAVLLSRRWAF